MTTVTYSSSSIGDESRCPRITYFKRVLGRRPIRKSAGLIGGSALHDAIEALQLGKPVADQEAAIDAVLAETPITASEKEYRTAGYLKDALAAFRAEHAVTFAGWVIEEIEQQGVIDLGVVTPRLGPLAGQEVLVRWEFRRDIVGLSPYGDRWIVDWKSTSRNEDAQVKAWENSGQFMGYIMSWRVQHPTKPVKGVLPVRLVLRKPSRNGVQFEFPKDSEVTFSDERLAEWQRHTLRKVRTILERDPQDADDWPMACAELGCCRHTYGCCEFIGTCTLPPSDRALKLSTDEFEANDAHKRPANGDEP